jgi:hypothetical protein
MREGPICARSDQHKLVREVIESGAQALNRLTGQQWERIGGLSDADRMDHALGIWVVASGDDEWV